MVCIPLLQAGERKIDPTFLHRDTSAVKASNSDLTAAGCHYIVAVFVAHHRAAGWAPHKTYRPFVF
jgi:hypothetical protein